MLIDILVNSCARVDLLDQSISTFRKHIKTDKHEFRWVIVEDKVDDELRQLKGSVWIKNHIDLFDKVVFLEKKAGPGYWWAKTIEHCESNYHIHLEDDCKFMTDINIDPIIDLMINHNDIAEIIFRRDTARKNDNSTTVENLKLTEMNLMSVASGIFNTKNVIKIIDKIGWKNQLHEAGNLTPTSKKIGLRKFILDHKKVHYIHVGKKKYYRKGKWIEKR